MSFGDRLVLWLHIAAAIFTIGPVTLAISSTPRYIRRGDVQVVRYLRRITAIFTAAALLVLAFGIVLANIRHDFTTPWLTVSITLFVVAIVLLALIVRDQGKAIRALAEAPAAATPVSAAGAGPVPAEADQAGQPEPGPPTAEPGPAAAEPGPVAAATAQAAHIASVERGRIAALGGIVNLFWLVILVLMVWRP